MKATVLSALASTVLVALGACGGGSGGARLSTGAYTDALLNADDKLEERLFSEQKDFCRLQLESDREFLDDIDGLIVRSSELRNLHEEWILTIEEELLERETWCDLIDEYDTWESFFDDDPLDTDEYAQLDEAEDRRADACEAVADALEEESICD